MLAQNATLPVDSTTGQFVYAQIVEVKNSKEALYKNAQTWIAKSFGDYKKVIQFEDKEAGRLILKGFSPIDDILMDQLKYVITIDCKANKYRVMLTEPEQATSRMQISERYMLTPEMQRERIRRNQHELNQIKEELTTATKKSRIAELKKKQADTEEFLVKNDAYIEQVNAKVADLFKSLKQAMVVNNEF